MILCWEFCGLKRRVNPLKHCRSDSMVNSQNTPAEARYGGTLFIFVTNIKDCYKTDQSWVLYQCRQILVSILAHYTVLTPGLPHGFLGFVIPASSKIRREKVHWPFFFGVCNQQTMCNNNRNLFLVRKPAVSEETRAMQQSNSDTKNPKYREIPVHRSEPPVVPAILKDLLCSKMGGAAKTLGAPSRDSSFSSLRRS